jgi:large subunit ribosomal protein L6
MPIDLPKGVKLTMTDGVLTVEGPKGSLTQEIRPEVTLKIEDNVATVVPVVADKTGGAYQRH